MKQYIGLLFVVILSGWMATACSSEEVQETASTVEETAETAERVEKSFEKPPVEEPKKVTEVTNLDVTTFMENMAAFEGIILDVRTPSEVAEGVIPGAIHINVHDDDFAQQAAKLDQSKMIVAYCKKGGRSTEAAKVLRSLKFPIVYNLQGGFEEWKASGGEVTTLEE